MSDTTYVITKQCVNCFKHNDKDKNTCELCGLLMVTEIAYQSKEYQERYKDAISKKFAEADKKNQQDNSIEDLR